MRQFLYRAWVGQELFPVRAIFWDRTSECISEIRYANVDGEVYAIKGDELKSVDLMSSTGVRETGTNRFIFEGDVVSIEYQRGNSLCVVEWCGVKSALVLRPISGNRPKNQIHFRLSGKKRIVILGNIHENGELLSRD